MFTFGSGMEARMNLEKLLKKEKEDIENMLLEVETYIEKCDKVLNTYHLTCSSSHGTLQYLLNGSYVSKKDLSMVKLVAQLDYYKQIVIELKKRERVINRVLKQCDNSKLDQIYLHQCEGRRKIVTPIQEPKEIFIQRWMNEEYEASDRWDDDKNFFYTLKGEKVRSKAEKIIADELANYDVPYKYEYPLKLTVGKQIKIFRPDFIVLNCESRKEYILEHLGMMDKLSYYNFNLNKLHVFEQNGYLLGINLLITHETSDSPIDVLTLRKYIEEYFI